MRRLIVAAIVLLALTAPASGAPGALEAVVNTDGYVLETVTMAAGSDLMFANLDVLNSHSITSTDFVNDVPLFDSGLVGPRQTETMSSLAVFPAGDYGFYCSAHIGMNGLLQIR